MDVTENEGEIADADLKFGTVVVGLKLGYVTNLTPFSGHRG